MAFCSAGVRVLQSTPVVSVRPRSIPFHPVVAVKVRSRGFRCSASDSDEEEVSDRVPQDMSSDAVFYSSCAGEFSLVLVALAIAPFLGVTEQFRNVNASPLAVASGLAFTAPLLALGLGLKEIPAKPFQNVSLNCTVKERDDPTRSCHCTRSMQRKQRE